MQEIKEIINRIKYNDETTKDMSTVIAYAQTVNREILLEGEITDGTGVGIETVIRFFNQYDEAEHIPVSERTPIKIYIDSPGGNLTDTLTMVDAIKFSKTPVYTICSGCAYSGGFFTFIAGHKRFAYPHASFLYHEGSTGNGGTASQFENYAAFYRKQVNQLKDIVLNNTKITEEEYEKMKKDDCWYLADEALEKGICDEIIEGFIL